MTPHLAAVAAVVLVVGSTCVVADSVAGLRGVVRFANSSAEQQLWDGPEGVAVHADVIVAPGIPALTWSALTEVGGLFELRGLPSCRDVVLRSDAVSWGVEQPVTARTPCPESGSLAFPAALIATRAPVSGHVRSRTAGGAAPIGGVAVAVSVEGSSAPPVRVRTLADGSYSTAGAAPGFPLGSVVTVAVDAAAAAEAGIDAFEAGDGTARFRLGPGPHGEAPSADLAPVPMSARVLAALASALPKRVAALLPAPPEPEWRLAAPAFVAATYAVCGVIHGENVRHLHAGGDIARSVRLFSADPVTNGWAETGSRVGSAFAAAPLRRAAALTAQDAARFLWQKYSAAARSEGPLSSRGPQEFCLRGIPPGTFAVVPAVTPPEAAGGIRVEPAGFFVTAGPQLHSRAPAAAAAATSALRFDVVAPSLSGTVAGLAPLPAPAQGGDTAKVQVVFQPLDDSAPNGPPRSVPVTPAAAGSPRGLWQTGALWPGAYLVAACSWAEGASAGGGRGTKGDPSPWCWAEPDVRGGGHNASATAAPAAAWSFAPASAGASPSCSAAVVMHVGRADEEGGEPEVHFQQAGHLVFPRAAAGSPAIPLRLRRVDQGPGEAALFDAVARPLSDSPSPPATPTPPLASPPSILTSILQLVSRVPATAAAAGLIPDPDPSVGGVRVFFAWLAKTAFALFDALRDHILDPASLPGALLHASMGRRSSGGFLPAPAPPLLAFQPDFRAWLHEDPHARHRRTMLGEMEAAEAGLPVAVRAADAASTGGVCLPVGSYVVEAAAARLPCLVLANGGAEQSSGGDGVVWRVGADDGEVAAASAPLRIGGWWLPSALVLPPHPESNDAAASVCTALAAARVTLQVSAAPASRIASVSGRLLALSPPPPAVRAALDAACGTTTPLPSPAPPSASGPSGLALRVDYAPALAALAGAAPARLRLPVRVEAPLGLAVSVAVCGGAPAASAAAGPAAWGGDAPSSCPAALPDAEAGEPGDVC